ncbi:hypothetical protein D3C79_1057930 [compost metagenome]
MPRQGRLERLLPAGSRVDPHSGMNRQFTAISRLPGTGLELFFPKRNQCGPGLPDGQTFHLRLFSSLNSKKRSRRTSGKLRRL